MTLQNLRSYGWNEEWNAKWQKIAKPQALPGRVITDFGGYLVVQTPQSFRATIAKKMRHTFAPDALPKVGDWVLIRPEDNEIAVIEDILPRTSAIIRKSAGARPEPQVLAANVDIAFVVQALNEDFNLARLDRYAFQLKESGVQSVFIFNKLDLADKRKIEALQQWKKPAVLVNARTGQGTEELLKYLQQGKTAVFIGSSGVGKSTLVNKLLGDERQKTGEIDNEGKGRHTTSHRELFLVPDGGVIIDTPGIRELQLWGEKGSLEEVFPDIMALAAHCKFRNCTHTPKEQGCAVQQALREGTLSQERFESFRKLRLELSEL